MSTILSDIQEIVERSLFESIRLILVEHNYLPDVVVYNDNDAGKAAYQTEIDNIVILKGFAIEVFGHSSSQKKYAKKVPRIVIYPKRIIPGDIGGGPDPEFILEGGSYTKKTQPPRTSTYEFEINVISNSAKQDRLMNAILAIAIPSRGYVKFYNDPLNSFFVEQYSFRESPDTQEGINEKFYMYRAIDLYFAEGQIIETGISPLKSIGVDILDRLDNKDDNLTIPNLL